MAIIDIKFTKFDNRPWGFRLAGGSDFPQPLTVIRVTEESLAECMGLKVGDVVVRLNDQPISDLTHGQAHEALSLAGNNFVLSVKRAKDPSNLEEILPEEDIVPYTIPLDSLPPLLPLEEKLLETTTVTEIHSCVEETTTKVVENGISEDVPNEEDKQKPLDEDSEVVPNKNLTDDEIAQLILEEEELLPDKGVLGVNFKKLRPRAPILKESKVLEALQDEAVAEPPQIQEKKRTTTFLQKPQRPPPTPRKNKDEPENKVEPYRVVIKKQPKKTAIERLLEKGLIRPEDVKSSEERSEKTTPPVTPDPLARTERESDSRPQSKAEVVEAEVTEVVTEQTEESSEKLEPGVEKSVDEEEKGSVQEETAMSQEATSLPSFDKERVQELVSTEISLEKQLENVQSQLLALKQLPSEIEKHLKIVSDQLHRIMELSGVQNGKVTKEETCVKEEVNEPCHCSTKQENVQEEEEESKLEEHSEQQQQSESEWDDPSFSVSFTDNAPQNTEAAHESTDESEARELEISVKSDDEDGKRVKKYIVSYESKVLAKKEEIRRSETSSPALSHGSFEPDPNLAPKDQVIQELQHRKGRKRSKDLWPQAKQLELTYGRRWRCPNDFFNDEMIAEVLQSQAEVIRGKALGVNFKKFEKTALPNYDHLMNSSVFKMIHKMEREPKKGIPARPPKVNAAEDILERVNSPSLSTMDDRSSLRSVSH